MDKDLQTIAKLEAILAEKRLEEFDEEDIAILKRVIDLVRGLEALGFFAGFLKKFIIGLAAVVTSLVAIKMGALDLIGWLLGHLGSSLGGKP